MYGSSEEASCRLRESEVGCISKTIASVSMEVTISVFSVLVRIHLSTVLNFGTPAQDRHGNPEASPVTKGIRWLKQKESLREWGFVQPWEEKAQKASNCCLQLPNQSTMRC